MKKLFFLIFLIFFGCTSTGLHTKEIKSWKELREQNVSMQKYDFSCGTGSLATLMNYFFGDNVSEENLVKEFLNSIPEDKKEDRKDKGLSLLDLKNIAESKGYQAYAVSFKEKSIYEMDVKINRPFLVYMETAEFKHFSVFVGIREDRVLLADSSMGNIKIPVEKFLMEWKNKMALVLYKKGFEPVPNNPFFIDTEKPFRSEVIAVRQSIFFKP